jgi:hypothetical protein
VEKREIVVHAGMNRLELEEMIKGWAEREDVQIRPMGRLARQYKTEGEAMHWHISGQKKGMGTVEVTYTPSDGKLTILVHENRRGLWAGHAYRGLVREITKSPKARRV